jgi:hypothetical protein
MRNLLRTVPSDLYSEWFFGVVVNIVIPASPL